ncbi:hypothetical protein [Alishewanella phage vB_AspM_Slickus01]|nr:hypothetical protein [Alishewanella phage vB_AspM_Slickus01]
MHIKPKPDQRVVVRLTTSWFKTKRGLSCRKDLTYMKRKSWGFNPLEEYEPCDLEPYINLNELSDGLYEVVLRGNEDDFWVEFIPFFDIEYTSDVSLFLNKLCTCSKNIVGYPESYSYGVFYGKNAKGGNWQSNSPARKVSTEKLLKFDPHA